MKLTRQWLLVASSMYCRLSAVFSALPSQTCFMPFMVRASL